MEMPNTFDQVPEIKLLHFEAAVSKLDLLLALFWSVAHDIVINSQQMYVAGIPFAFIVLMLVARVALRTSVIGKILQSEFTL